MGKGDGAGSGAGKGAGQGSGKVSGYGTERIAVPAMPMPMAVVCCILNFFIPGVGTIVAGFSHCCCSRNEEMTKSKKCSMFCFNYMIGFLQAATAGIFGLGFIWSCVWGVFFLGKSRDYYRKNRVGHVQVTHARVIVMQPQPLTNGQPESQLYGQPQQHPSGYSGVESYGPTQYTEYSQTSPYSKVAVDPNERSQAGQQQGTVMYPPPPSLYN